jgi:hypothetical protein
MHQMLGFTYPKHKYYNPYSGVRNLWKVKHCQFFDQLVTTKMLAYDFKDSNCSEHMEYYEKNE